MAAISSGSHPKKGSPFHTPQPPAMPAFGLGSGDPFPFSIFNPTHCQSEAPHKLTGLSQTILNNGCILFLLFLANDLCLKSQCCPRCEYTFLSARTPLAPKPPSGENETLLVPGRSAHGMPCPQLGNGVNKLLLGGERKGAGERKLCRGKGRGIPAAVVRQLSPSSCSLPC